MDVIPNSKALEAEAEDEDNKSILTVSEDYASATSLSHEDYEALATVIGNNNTEKFSSFVKNSVASDM